MAFDRRCAQREQLLWRSDFLEGKEDADCGGFDGIAEQFGATIPTIAALRVHIRVEPCGVRDAQK